MKCRDVQSPTCENERVMFCQMAYTMLCMTGVSLQESAVVIPGQWVQAGVQFLLDLNHAETWCYLCGPERLLISLFPLGAHT